MLSLNYRTLTHIGIWFLAFLFPILIMKNIGVFINTGALSVYWLLLAPIISLGVLLKFKIARWLMLLGFWLLFFYQFIGTNIGMTTSFSNNIWTLVSSWSFATFIDAFPDLSSLIILYGFYIFVLSTNESYKVFGLDKNIRIHELFSFGLITFVTMHFNLIYYWFLS